MEFQRRPSSVSQLSYSDTELDMIDGDFMSELNSRSHFFAPHGKSYFRQHHSTPLILISPGNSTHNSTSSIPSSLSTTATNHTHNGTSSPPLPQPSSPASFQRGSKPKKFSLNLNGHLTPSPSPLSPGLEPADKKEEYIERGVHQGNMYINKEGLVHDLKALSTMPELCDVTFLVGEDRQPVCGVKAILAARSR